jgi:hypothetical protein
MYLLNIIVKNPKCFLKLTKISEASGRDNFFPCYKTNFGEKGSVSWVILLSKRRIRLRKKAQGANNRYTAQETLFFKNLFRNLCEKII